MRIPHVLFCNTQSWDTIAPLVSRSRESIAPHPSCPLVSQARPNQPQRWSLSVSLSITHTSIHGVMILKVHFLPSYAWLRLRSRDLLPPRLSIQQILVTWSKYLYLVTHPLCSERQRHITLWPWTERELLVAVFLTSVVLYAVASRSKECARTRVGATIDSVVSQP